jgi:transketolase
MRKISNNIRKAILKMNSATNCSHSGSALSVVDILTVLYFKILNIDPQDPVKKDRDKLILSKGHGSTALYSTLAERGFFSKNILKKFYCDDGVLPGHLDKEAVPGVEASAGSLGHGLSIGVGMALAHKTDHNPGHIYVILGDGELNEGSIWEALLLAPQLRLKNLTAIIDYNKLQGYGRTNEVINLEPLKDKLISFNWQVAEIDGHNYQQIEESIKEKSAKPKIIIAHTIKGKGVSFMENKLEWHYKSPNDEELEQGLNELA